MTISFALAHCAVNKGHIALTLFVDRLSPRVRAFFDTIVSILGALLYFILAWEVAKYAIHMRDIGEVSLTMEIPFYPFILGVAFGLLMLALVSLIDLFKSLVRLFNK
jgi:TRAP-type C4-dicarboxylate transport system permease small subunit